MQPDVTMPAVIEVKFGQMWERMKGKSKVRIEGVEAGRALTRNITTNRFTWVRLDRFRPTSRGYKLIVDVPEPTQHAVA